MKKIAYLFLFVICTIPVVAEASTGHVIVAFDRSIFNYQSTYSNVGTLYSIDNFIKRKLQFDDLYLSVVGYTLNGMDPNMENFVLPYTDTAGNPVLWCNYESLVVKFPKWPEGHQPDMKNYVKPGSMQSLAKPYCVMETAVWAENQRADATYVVFVTDEKVQGVDDDYRREWNEMKFYNKEAYERIEHQVFQQLQRFNDMYRFESRDRETLDNKYVIAMYELLPASKPSIYSVSDMPSPLPMKRVRGGYIIECKVKSVDAHYKVCDWSVIGVDGNVFERNSDGYIFVRSGMLHDDDSIEIRMELQQTDSFYGGVLLNERNCIGLALRQSVKMNEGSKIWGVVPLSDAFWWWMSDDVEAAVKIWEYIIFILFISSLVYIYRTLSKHLRLYRPSNKEISVNIRTSNN